jgi:hypothetical protein
MAIQGRQPGRKPHGRSRVPWGGKGLFATRDFCYGFDKGEQLLSHSKYAIADEVLYR